MDKNKAVIDFLIQCPAIQNSSLYFNFTQAEDDNKQFVTEGNDKLMDKPFIDGSVQKRYTFTIIDYRSVAYQALVKDPNFIEVNENVEEMLDVQGIMDWINEQADAHNYPDFGEDCFIDDMKTLTENPNMNGVDTSLTPGLAKYSMSVQIDYIDNSKRNH